MELLVAGEDENMMQLVLRSDDHTAYYSPASHSLSLRPRIRPRMAPTAGVMLRPRPYPPLARSEPGTVATGSSYPEYDLGISTIDDHPSRASLDVCPTCLRPWSYPAAEFGQDSPEEQHLPQRPPAQDTYFQPPFTAPNYFRLLEAFPRVDDRSSGTPRSTPAPYEMLTDDDPRISWLDDDGHSVPGTPLPPSPKRNSPHGSSIDASSTAPGYYGRFFTQIKKLGRGARGQVYLCQHVLNGNKLGVYAVKKMPCGDDQQVLLDSLKEVLLMETLVHPNIIHYQHAWIENARASKFAPSVPTLFILMAAANGGSLEDWINTRSGRPAESGSSTPQASSGLATRAEKLKAAFRLHKAAHQQHSSRVQTGVAVHLLREDEVMSLARDIVAGLGFLHSKGILHQDVKPANCLLHWSEDALTPRVLLSDFGSSALLHDNWHRQRSGHTGTMEFMAPEAVRIDARTGMLQELSAKSDIWSFGMILHLLIFLRLPYSQVDDVDQLREEMLAYRGWQDEAECMLSNIHTCQSFIPLLSKLLQMDPISRPSADEILEELRQLAQDRGLGPVPTEPYEMADPYGSDMGRERAREQARLRRRRRQSTSTVVPNDIRRPRLLAPLDSEDRSEKDQPGIPLWMASDLAANHPLVRYQQERMGLTSPPRVVRPWRHLDRLIHSGLRMRRHVRRILPVGVACIERIALDVYCLPGRITRGWDYGFLFVVLVAVVAGTEEIFVRPLHPRFQSLASRRTSAMAWLPWGLLVMPFVIGFSTGLDACSF